MLVDAASGSKYQLSKDESHQRKKRRKLGKKESPNKDLNLYSN